MLWIAAHLPCLPLEAFPSPPSAEPRAVNEAQTLLVCNAAATARGVHAGMRLSAACALAPDLMHRPRDAAVEAAALDTLAAWAQQFTPNVSLEPPHALLLDIEGSLKLLGGLRPIVDALRQGLADMGYTASLACAPNATAALLLARGGDGTFIHSRRGLGAALSALPITALGADPAMLQVCHATGVRTLGELRALPRDGTARRFGRPVLDMLDRAAGLLPAPRRFFTLPARFDAKLELPAAAQASPALLFAAQRLVAQLAGLLAARNGGIQHCVWTLLHERGAAPTVLEFRLVAPTRDPVHLMLLMRERCAALTLKAPVHAMQLAAAEILALAGDTRTLFADHIQPEGEWQKLVERLQARLGEQAVHGLSSEPGHRPERSWRRVAPGTRSLRMDRRPRPLWLLPEPQPLGATDPPHYRNAPLAVLAGPERIESGWWDEDAIKRDYFVARSPDHATVWIYRERKRPGGWFLHGIFG